MNWYFYKIWLPVQLLSIIFFITTYLGYTHLSWYTILISWFFIGPIGIGVGFHRLFSHRQFFTYKTVERLLAILGTLSAYAPVLFWASQHQYHHKVSDTEADPSSPVVHGFWESFLWYRMRHQVLNKINLKNYCVRLLLRDKFLLWISFNFVTIIWCYIIILSLIDFNLLINMFLVPVFIEHCRINVVSSLSHIKLPLSYRNFETNDQSYNNLILGYLTFGFGWHNNHHANARELVNCHQWWEIDIEGLIGNFLSKSKTS